MASEKSIMHRQVALLTGAQALFQTVSVLVMTIGALAGSILAPSPEWATAPIAAMFLGTAVGTVPASAWMSRVGRRIGFVAGALLGTVGGLLAAAGMIFNSLLLLCLGTFLVGTYQSFAQFYRFAASEVADDAFRPRAISLVLAGGVVAALAGPALARLGGDLMVPTYTASFIILAVVSLAGALLLLGLRIPVPAAAPADNTSARPLLEIMRQPTYLVALFGAASGYGIDLERELIKVLPYLFQDIHFREKHFYQEANIVAQLVDHVFAAPSTYQPAEQRRIFGLHDLPVDPLDFKESAVQAQNALRFLYAIPEAPKIAVELVNRCLDTAIGRTLSFTGDRLVGLMDDLRRHLFSERRELVLLIEDFARVQGLDRALLQAMIVQGDETNPLCKLRWAIGVTTGFFEQVVDTVYTRLTHFVNMDRSAGRRVSERMDTGSLAEFSGPYLNAARLGVARLVKWDADGASEPVPNACVGCPEIEVCHPTFGVTSQGYGLYPFTARALWLMANRADDQVEDAFNPRTLQSGVLLPVLDDAAPLLATGQFPPKSLLDKLGGNRSLDAAARQELRRLVGGEDGRVGALLELWDGSGHLVNAGLNARRLPCPHRALRRPDTRASA